MTAWRTPDTWVLAVYLDEAGWEEWQYMFFRRHKDAEYVGAALAERFRDYRNGSGLDYVVYRAEPHESFFGREPERDALVASLVRDWKEEE